MSKISITPESFVDFVISFLLNKMMNNKDMMGDNERFNTLISKMEKGGMKSYLLKEFLSFDSRQRMDFKRIKDVFEGKDKTRNTIDIVPNNSKKEKKKEKKADVGLVKRITKKVIGEARRYRIRTGCLLKKDRMEKLIDKVLNEELKGEE